MSKFEISLGKAFIDNNKMAFLVKILLEFLEVNIYLPLEELNAFYLFADGCSMRAQVGISANSRVHWLRDEEDVYVLIGVDDQAWDISLLIDQDLLNKIRSAIQEIELEIVKER